MGHDAGIPGTTVTAARASMESCSLSRSHNDFCAHDERLLLKRRIVLNRVLYLVIGLCYPMGSMYQIS